MGRRSIDAEGYRARLSENDVGDLRQLAANLVDKFLCRGLVRRATGLVLVEERLDAIGGGRDQLLAAAIEPPATRLAGIVPLGDNFIVLIEVGGRTRTERLNQPKCMAHAGKARDCFRIGLRLGFRRRIGEQMKHRTGVTGQG